MTYNLSARITRLEGAMFMGRCPRCHNHHIAIRGIDPETGMEWIDDVVSIQHECTHCGRAPDQWIDIVGVRGDEMP